MITCIVSSPQNTDTYNDLKSIFLPSYSGQTQILPGHAEGFFKLTEGDMLLEHTNDSKKTINIKEAECYINEDTVTIILD